jgi:FKBP-type peptidyl-prolyl cis-trans isomerase (trigger factor)
MRQTQLLPTVEDFRVNVQNNDVEVDVANDVIPEIELPDSYELEVLEKVLANVGLNSNFAIAINDVITRYVSDNTEGRVYSLNLLANEF